MPVEFVDYSTGSAVAYYMHVDQVMTPQKLTDASGLVVWDRVQDTFGVEVSATGALTQPSRFPGQYADSETNLHQNWHRDYDPSLGRYIQSDPIGLMGGINTYAYVEGNPLTRVDPTGELFVLAAALSPPVLAGGAAILAGAGALLFHDQLTQAATDTYNICRRSGGDECEELNKIDTDTCNAITRQRGARAGAICHASASQRYAECRAGGIGNVRTPLSTWNN